MIAKHLTQEADVTQPDYEAMRRDAANWRLGVIYYCADDPRVVVRNRGRFGWAWNFAQPYVLPAIAVAVAVFLGLPALAWWLGARSPAVMLLAASVALAGIVLAAHYLARDPGAP